MNNVNIGTCTNEGEMDAFGDKWEEDPQDE